MTGYYAGKKEYFARYLKSNADNTENGAEGGIRARYYYRYIKR